MFIRQSAEEIKQSLIVNSNTAIDAIRLVEASLWSASPGQFAHEMTAESEARFRPGACRHSPESVTFEISFKFTVRKSEEGRKPEDVKKPEDLIKISCLFEAEYSLKPDFHPTEEQLRAFHHGNAVFNCWPYFREFVQNSAVRMHLPPPPVPFLRLMPPQKKESDKPNALSQRKGLRLEDEEK
jgi:hypothetical protein